MHSAYAWNGVRLLGYSTIVAFAACSYTAPTSENPGGIGGSGGKNPVSSSSSSGDGGTTNNGGKGGQGVSSSSSGEGGAQSSSSSGEGGAQSSSSSGEGGAQSSSSSSSSSTSTSGGIPNGVACNGDTCIPIFGTHGCCFESMQPITCESPLMCEGTMFYCDGKEDCITGTCCLDGNSARCGLSCGGAVVCNDDTDCPNNGTCVIVQGSYGTCQ